MATEKGGDSHEASESPLRTTEESGTTQHDVTSITNSGGREGSPALNQTDPRSNSSNSKASLTLSSCVCDCNITNKWVKVDKMGNRKK